jgi:hypothetical protein
LATLSLVSSSANATPLLLFSSDMPSEMFHIVFLTFESNYITCSFRNRMPHEIRAVTTERKSLLFCGMAEWQV